MQFLVAADSNKQFRVPLDKGVNVGSIMQSAAFGDVGIVGGYLCHQAAQCYAFETRGGLTMA